MKDKENLHSENIVPIDFSTQMLFKIIAQDYIEIEEKVTYIVQTRDIETNNHMNNTIYLNNIIKKLDLIF